MIAAAHSAYPQLSLHRLCALFGLNRAWYYAAQEEADDTVETALRDAIERVVLDFPGYGYRRVTKALQREGWTVNHKHVLRIMREESLLCHLKRRFVLTTTSAHGAQAYPNLLAEAVLSAPDRAWVADITYIHLPTTFAYLAALLDAYSRRCVGWELSRCIDTRLTLAALDRAGPAATAAGPNPPLGSRRPIRERRLRRTAGERRRPDQHGCPGQSLRQCQGREFFQDPEARGGTFEGVPHVRRRRGEHPDVHRGRLQHQAAALELGLSPTRRVRGRVR